MKCSIIIAVLDSHEIFRRQMLHFDRMLPEGFEVLIIDDGSDEPLKYDAPVRFPLRLFYTNDKRPWTQDKARNLGAAAARGNYLLMTDIDHILTSEAIEEVGQFRGDMLKFSRRTAQLDEQGVIYNIGATKPPHVNTFAVSKETFERLGGYRETFAEYGTDREIRANYQQLVEQGLAKPFQVGKTIYVITETHWFHRLPRISTKK